jgi:hypothetical protein
VAASPKKLAYSDRGPRRPALLCAQVRPTPTASVGLHDVALELGLAINHSAYDTLYVAFAVAVGADRVVVADGPFVRAMQKHPDAAMTRMLLPLSEWAAVSGIV